MTDKEHLWIPDSEVNLTKKTSGGSSGEPRQDRSEHAVRLRRSMCTVVDEMSDGVYSFDSSDYQVYVIRFGKGKAENHGRVLKGLGINVNAVLDEHRLLVSSRRGHLSELDNLLQEYGSSTDIPKGSRGFDLIDDFEPNSGLDKYFDPDDSDKDADGPVDVIVSLIPKMPKEDYVAAIPRVISNVEGLGGKVIDAVEPGCRELEVSLPSREAVLSMCDDQGIYRISKVRKATLDDFFLSANRPRDLVIDNTVDIDGLPVVCIIDNGISKDGPLGPLVIDTMYPSKCVDFNSHGTGVAGRCAFGYTPLALEDLILVPRCKLIDCNVFFEGMNEKDLVGILDDIVERYHTICRIYNISINLGRFNRNMVSALAYRMDELQRKYGILFVSSVGNVNEWSEIASIGDLITSEQTRIESPSESAFAVSVGSAVMSGLASSISRAGMTAPYSRHGPGLGDSIKPELVAYTANVGRESSTTYCSNDQGSFVMTGDSPRSAAGTSFAAPVVAGALARISSSFEELGPLMWKGILVHNVQPMSHACSVWNRTGYGIVDLDGCLNSSENRVTFLHKGTIGGEFKRHHIRIAVPESFRNRDCTIVVTCISEPIVDRDYGPGYIRSRVVATLKRLDEGGRFVSINPSRRFPMGDSPCRRTQYVLKNAETSEFRVDVTSTISDESLGSTIQYALVLSIEDDSGSIDLYDAYIASGRYPVISEVMNDLRVRADVEASVLERNNVMI